VRDLFRRFSLAENRCLIVVADRLLALDRLVTGRYWNPENVFERARRDAGQVLRLIENTARSYKAEEKIKIVFWDEVAKLPEYVSHYERLIEGLREYPEFLGEIDAFVETRLDRFGAKADPNIAREAEREYVLSEVAMSTFCTERLEYSTEVWERRSPIATDPLAVLYSTHGGLLRKVINANPVRRLEYLYDDAR
jgi:hypothetical protein